MRTKLHRRSLILWGMLLMLTATALPQLQAQQPVISIKTTKQKGESIKLSINANGAVSVIGAEEISGDKYNKVYSVEAEDGSITIIGDVTKLDCSNNQLTELNVSQNELLKTINCYNNQIEQLDLSNNKNLTILNCGYNRLSELKLKNLTKLSSLDCASNQLTHLDLSQNAELLILACSHNQLTSLDLSHNTKLNHIDCLVNQIKDVGMDKLVQSLPDRKGMQSGTIIAIAVYSDKEGNVCTKDQVATAKERGWIVKTDQGQEYPGQGVKETFTINYTATENGSLEIKKGEEVIASGSKVEAGSELTIIATAHKDYELKDSKVLVNGKELLLSREGQVYTGRFTVETDVEVAAVFVDISALTTVAGSNLELYPNPASDIVRITHAMPFATVSLYSIDGALLLQTTTDAQGDAQLTIESLPSGRYLVQVGTSDSLPVIIKD